MYGMYTVQLVVHYNSTCRGSPSTGTCTLQTVTCSTVQYTCRYGHQVQVHVHCTQLLAVQCSIPAGMVTRYWYMYTAHSYLQYSAVYLQVWLPGTHTCTLHTVTCSTVQYTCRYGHKVQVHVHCTQLPAVQCSIPAGRVTVKNYL